MSFKTLKKWFFSMLFLFPPLIAFAQSGRTQPVALVPFWGDDEQFIEEFGEVLKDAVGNLQGYTPVTIDMTNLPDDVPEGGFPPYICPSPSLTKTIPIAVTGEMTRDEYDDELWSLRLYLWEMTETRLVFSDKLDAYDREEAEANMPALVEWLFDWLKRGGRGTGEGDNVDLSDLYGSGKHVFITTSMPLHWMYLGGRIGAQARPNWSGSNQTDNLYSANGAVSFSLALFPESVPFFSRLVFQVEGIFNYNFYPVQTFTEMTVSPGALLKFQAYRQGNLLWSIFGGAYNSISLNKNIHYDYDLFPNIGWTAGMNFGGKFDPLPGIFYIDVRFSKDEFNTWIDGQDYHRMAVTLCIGYEYGFVTKK